MRQSICINSASGRKRSRNSASRKGIEVGLDLDAHEIAPVEVIGVEARLEDPAAVLGDEAGDARDDADLVGAGGGQRVVARGMHQILAEALSISARSSA
jgi:hypothetical protein